MFSSALFGIGISKKQVVGYVLIAGCALLWQIVRPSERFQNGTDEILFGDGFIGIFEAGKFFELVRDTCTERGECLWLGDGGFPLVCGF